MKRTPLKRSRRRSRSAEEKRASEIFGMGGPCEVDDGHECHGRVQSHHVVSKEKLKDLGRLELLWDIANRMRVCERRHAQHTSAAERIPLCLVPARARAFAAALGLEWWLERFYA